MKNDKKFDWREAVEEEINKTSEVKEKDNGEHIALDDTQRLKVLSPGRLVFNRFIRSKLAITGSIILILMFAFSFLGALFTPYKESEVFHTLKYQNSDYGVAQEKREYDNYVFEGAEIDYRVKAYVTSIANEIDEKGLTSLPIEDPSGQADYILTKLGDKVFKLEKTGLKEVVTYDKVVDVFTFKLQEYDSPALRSKIRTITGKEAVSFTVNGQEYFATVSGKEIKVSIMSDIEMVMVASKFVFHNYTVGNVLTESFKRAALLAAYGSGTFVYEGTDYRLIKDDNTFLVQREIDGVYENYVLMLTFSAQRSTGEDSLSVDYKLYLQELITKMEDERLTNLEFTFEGEDFNLYRADLMYRIQQVQELYLIDIFAPPSSEHLLGTDGNGMDVLTRMMYGGRISLLIGFVVVFFELLIGVILGGISGYFGGWIDNLIMRVVDLFNCLPFTPILIMLGAIFDKMNVDSYIRLLYLMIAMGVMGWTGIARLVRGQILSLREQEFMLAANASGLSTRRKIFKHLVPNVMPQLIVNATMGLGQVILVESSLSFLGLGAKYPVATWGQIINGVKDSYSLLHYTYIWIPVGILICLTVIAFNFVGDGLRDAFDPKMKR